MTDEAKNTNNPNAEDLRPKAKEPDHGIDPRTVEGTPQAAEAEAMNDPAVDEAPFGFVDLQMRKRVNRRKARGLPCIAGPDFLGCRVLIRPWSARPIQIFREKYESQLLARNPKLKAGDELDPADKIELNRATSVMSVQGIEGKFWIGPGQGMEFTLPDRDDDVGIKAHRRFISTHFLPPYEPERPESADEIDMDFLQLLMGLNEGLSKVAYQEIDRLGEDFVYGATEALDYADSNR